MEYGGYEEYDGHTGDGGEGYGGWGEIAVSSIYGDGDQADQINCIRFDGIEESLWMGTASGTIVQQICPNLERYSMITPHDHGILALRSMGQSILSVSPSQLCLHYSGCAPYIAYNDETGDLSAMETDHHHGALLGRTSGTISSFDLVAGRPRSTILNSTPDTTSTNKGIAAISGPLQRGSFVVATFDGHISLIDPRTNYRQSSPLIGHTGGFAAIDAAGDLVATAGYTNRMGRVSLDRVVKIFDARMGLRMLGSIPYQPGPTMLRFHPHYPTSLIVASSSGMFATIETSVLACGVIDGVHTEGDALLCCDISPSGECLVFGSSSGYVHLVSCTEESRVGIESILPTLPSQPETVPPQLHEEEPFVKVPMYFPPDGSGTMASDIHPKESMLVGLGQRIIDESLLATGKRSDFVIYLQNPKYDRDAAPGQSAAAVAEIRNKRQRPQFAIDAEAARAERARRRAERGGIILPGRYRRVVIKQPAGAMKFEEFDFGYYNKTQFAGFENALANSYTNALVQALFFAKPVRDMALSHAPDPAAEFSIIGELSLLFRMMNTKGANVCQTANLLRALRQSREAVALGLIEGTKGERSSTDIEVEAQKDKSLARRAQRLSRFLLEQLHKECAIYMNSNSSSGNTSGGDTTNTTTPVEDIFGLILRQRTICLSKPRPEQEKIVRSFQVELQYPSAKERPPIQWNINPTTTTTIGVESPTATGNTINTINNTTNINSSSSDNNTTTSRPSFSHLLSSSLHAVSDMRAWFDEVVTYQPVRQERIPCRLPDVMIVNCGLEDLDDLAWWQPTTTMMTTTIASSSSVVVENIDGGNSGDNSGGNSGNQVQVDNDNDTNTNTKITTDTLVDDDSSHQSIKIEGTLNNTKIIQKAWLPRAVAITTRPNTWQVEVEQGDTAHELIQHLGPLTDDAVRAVYELTAVVAHVRDEDEVAEAGQDYEGHLIAHIKVPDSYFEERRKMQMDDDHGSGENTTTTNTTTDTTTNTTNTNTTSPKFEWMVFNDFHITPCLPTEVTELYGGQKIPVLLYFTRIHDTTSDNTIPSSPTPVLSPEGFLQLCCAPPLQLQKPPPPHHTPPPLHPPSFTPLKPNELPQRGDLFALDAEFVAYSPPERIVRRGMDVEMRPSRLGLGRVSVVRGTGPLAGTPCIDDYIKSVEPVYDYLTQFSGLVLGDLDSLTSRHHLTTLRCAYLKLRYLVDAGVIFVGHGLKQDFRMLNIVVPKEQVVDTIDLYYTGRGRRLSLRFLSAYLLGAAIQSGVHDSVEDALAALKLYKKYLEMIQEGVFEARLSEMYMWGEMHGWEPSKWQSVPEHLSQQQQQSGSGSDGVSSSFVDEERPLVPPGLVKKIV